MMQHNVHRMRQRSHVIGAHGAMRRMAERDYDAQIANDRERFHYTVDHFGDFERRKESYQAISGIPLYNSLAARFIRWVRAGHRAVLRLSAVGLVVVVIAIAARWL